MDANLERGGMGETTLPRLQMKFSSRYINFFGREEQVRESIANRKLSMESQHQSGVAAPEQRALARKGEVTSHTALDNISNNIKDLILSIANWSFGTKTPAVAEAQAVAAADIKLVVLPSDNRVAPWFPAPKPATKKPVEPVSKQKGVVTIDSDLNKETKQISLLDPRPKNRDVHTLFSVLSARSEHVCSPIVYMDKKLEINPKMRMSLVDWILEVHYKFKLLPETLYLTAYIIDQYLSLVEVPERKLHLVGICAMLIACKYEEIKDPQLSDFIEIAGNTYTREEILGMEKEILNKHECYLAVSGAHMLLDRLVKAAKADKEFERMIYFFAESGLMQYDLYQYCSPSMVASLAVCAARCTLKKSPFWTDAVKHHTSISQLQLQDHAQVEVVDKRCMLEQIEDGAVSTSDVSD